LINSFWLSNYTTVSPAANHWTSPCILPMHMPLFMIILINLSLFLILITLVHPVVAFLPVMHSAYLPFICSLCMFVIRSIFIRSVFIHRVFIAVTRRVLIIVVK